MFDVWFRVDARPFKQALLNIVKRWSFMFKQHLIDHVTDRWEPGVAYHQPNYCTVSLCACIYYAELCSYASFQIPIFSPLHLSSHSLTHTTIPIIPPSTHTHLSLSFSLHPSIHTPPLTPICLHPSSPPLHSLTPIHSHPSSTLSFSHPSPHTHTPVQLEWPGAVHQVDQCWS